MCTMGRSLDVYIDGKLVKTCLLPGVAKMDPKAPLQLCPDGGFDGYISRASFYNTSITQDMARDIYYKGAIYSDSSWDSIPNYVYVIVLLLIVGLIAYTMYL